MHIVRVTHSALVLSTFFTGIRGYSHAVNEQKREVLTKIVDLRVTVIVS